VSDLAELHRNVQTARNEYEKVAQEFRQAVRDALQSGRSASSVAQELGVSRVRVYQLAEKS
jgi:transposase-like protein